MAFVGGGGGEVMGGGGRGSDGGGGGIDEIAHHCHQSLSCAIF